MLTIKDVERCFKDTLKVGATPHREPDFKQLFKDYGANTTVRGALWFVEEHNTGYDGLLHRWEFRFSDKDGKRVSFWADLLPNLLATVPEPIVKASDIKPLAPVTE